MSWLDELEYIHEYTCDSCGYVTSKKSHLKLDPLPECESCGCGTRYSGFQSMRLSIRTEVDYDQNGRKAVKVTNGDGSVTYMSKTKQQYLKNQTNKSQLTREYERHVQDQQENQFGKFRKALESKAKVTGPMGDIKQLEATYFSKGDE